MTACLRRDIQEAQPHRGKSIFRNLYLQRIPINSMIQMMSHLMIILSWIW
jgi:hypothetical protein